MSPIARGAPRGERDEGTGSARAGAVETHDAAALARDDPDVALMLRVQAGDRDAFAELIVGHQQEVRDLAYRYLGDAHAAEDAAQETFVRLYGARASYRPEARLRAYLLRITTNLCLSDLRSHRRTRTGSLSRASGGAPGSDRGGGAGDSPPDAGLADPRAPDPSAEAERNESVALLRTALHELPESQRMGLVLHRFHGLSYEEVGEALGLTVPAVKSLLFRARDNLRRRLAPLLGEAEAGAAEA